MPTAEAHVLTGRPGRYLAQLCQHASDMGGGRGHAMLSRHRGDGAGGQITHAEWTPSHGIIRTNWGECSLTAGAGALTLRAEAADEDSLRRLEDLITSRLQRFGRRDQLTVTWQRPGGTGQP